MEKAKEVLIGSKTSTQPFTIADSIQIKPEVSVRLNNNNDEPVTWISETKIKLWDPSTYSNSSKNKNSSKEKILKDALGYKSSILE